MWYKPAQQLSLFPLTTGCTGLLQKLDVLRPQMIAAAQEVYNDWEQDEEGVSWDLGSGGICDQIAKAIAGVVHDNLEDVITRDGGAPGDDHAYLLVSDGQAVIAVDIPSYIYEQGAGYKWTKIPDVKFEPQHIWIDPVDIKPSDLEEDYY